MRKIKLWLLTAVCTWACCCMLTSPALAAEGTCGENVFWHLDETTGALTISGTGIVDGNWQIPWLEYSDQIVSLTVEDGITEIVGDGLFAFHNNLTTVTIADSVRKIGQGVFTCCYALTELDLPAECELGNSVFSNCTALTEFTFPMGTTIPGMVLAGCKNLEKIYIPEGYTRIDDYAFYDCAKIRDIILPESLKSMELRAFGQCSRLEQIVILGTLDTLECISGVMIYPSLAAIYCFGDAPGELTGYAEYTFNQAVAKNFSFYYAEGTAGWENMSSYPTNTFDPHEPIPEFKTKGEFADEVMAVMNDLKSGSKPFTYSWLSGVPDMQEFLALQDAAQKAVEGCTTDREKIYAIHNFVADWFFYDYDFLYKDAPRETNGTWGAFSLITYQQTGDLTYRVGVCEDYANLSCMLLRALEIPCVILEGMAFNGTMALPHAWNAAYDGEEWIYFDSTWNSSNRYYSTERKFTSRPANGSWFDISPDIALWGGSSSMARCADLIMGLETEELFGTLSLDWTNFTMRYRVYGPVDESDTEIVIPEQVGQEVTVASTAFEGNTSLEKLICGAEVIERKAFEGCTALKEVILTDHVATIGSYAFYGLPELERVGWQASSLPRTESYKLRDRAFGECPKLKTVQLPNGISIMENNVFEYCTSLETVKLPAQLKELGSGAFTNCSRLKDVTLPDTLETMKDSAFIGCTSLQTLALPDSLKEVEVFAFQDCSALEKMTFPESVTTLGESLFWNCTALTEVYIPDSVKTLGSHMFSGCTALQDVRLSSELEAIPSNCFQNCSSLEYVEIPKTVTALEYGSFYGCTSLQEIHLPDGLEKVGQDAFQMCDSLRTLYIPDSVQLCEPYFVWNCAALEGLYIGGGMDSVYVSAFPHLPSLKWIRFPETLTYCEHIYNWDDWNEAALEAVIFSGPLPTRGANGATGFNGTAKVYYPEDEPSWQNALESLNTEFIPYRTDGVPTLDTTIWFEPVATCINPGVFGKEMTLVVAAYDQQGRMTSVGMRHCDPLDPPIYDVSLTIFEQNSVLENITTFWLDSNGQKPLIPSISA